MRKDEEVNRALAAYENAVRSSMPLSGVDEVSSAAFGQAGLSCDQTTESRQMRPHIIRRDTITEYSQRN